MKKIIFSTIVSSLFLGQLLVMQIAKAELLYPVELSSESTRVRFSKIKIQTHHKQIELSGSIKRRSYNSRVLPGKISYIVNDGQGNIIKKGGINYSPSLSLRRWKSGSHFSLVLPNDLPKDTRIQLAWRYR